MKQNNWFIGIAKFEKTNVTGTKQTVSEQYLIDAISFADAENKLLEHVSDSINGEIFVQAIKRENLSEMFFDSEASKWYKCKVNFITIDEATGAEKKSASYMYVQADEINGGRKKLEEGMKGTIEDWELVLIKETKILDVF